ncbi:hypothetical protein BKA81DRAFT_32960 [Phyllosticta paracitricarpa]
MGWGCRWLHRLSPRSFLFAFVSSPPHDGDERVTDDFLLFDSRSLHEEERSLGVHRHDECEVVLSRSGSCSDQIRRAGGSGPGLDPSRPEVRPVCPAPFRSPRTSTKLNTWCSAHR